MLSYWKEIDRAGRDCNPALAVVFAYPLSKTDDAITTMVRLGRVCQKNSSYGTENK
ncbi:hypothetical protein DPMN_120546 [Dreissena polymorpha]|uniref:Uncharacterized protein n=1 Tax=Dreissena polymorpha TaxID=45954 RepID=A0A9D4GP65_DREPO|nr:hypothetical protein DPMN_120546 [Dreissena polymorpha]